jgi:hypothetical protein
LTAPGELQIGAHGERRLDLRHDERIEVALPVVFDNGATGISCNVSASGIYIESEDQIPLGSPIGLTIEFDAQPGGRVRMRCDASILRVEEKDGRRGIAAAIQWHTP